MTNVNACAAFISSGLALEVLRASLRHCQYSRFQVNLLQLFPDFSLSNWTKIREVHGILKD